MFGKAPIRKIFLGKSSPPWSIVKIVPLKSFHRWNLCRTPVPHGVRRSCSVQWEMERFEVRRACRHRVQWPARVRSLADSHWQPAQVLNLSITGVLLQTVQTYKIGERVEVEIDFPTHPEARTVVTGLGYVVRDDCDAKCAAIHFDLGCAPTLRATSPPGGRAARP